MTLSYYVGNLSSRGAKGEAKHQAKMSDKQFLINRALGPKRVAEKKRDTAYNKKQFMAKKMGVNSTPKYALKKAEMGEKQHTGVYTGLAMAKKFNENLYNKTGKLSIKERQMGDYSHLNPKKVTKWKHKTLGSGITLHK